MTDLREAESVEPEEAELPGARIARLRRERWKKRCDEAKAKIERLRRDQSRKEEA